MADEAPPAPIIPSTDSTREIEGLRRDIAAERQRAQAAKAEAEAARQEAATAAAEREAHKADAESWRSHTKAQAAALTAKTAERLAATPESIRTRLAALPIEAQVAALDAIDEVRGAAPPVQTPPVHPQGGRASGSNPAPDELTPEERAWAAAQGGTVASLDVATVRTMYKAYTRK